MIEFNHFANLDFWFVLFVLGIYAIIQYSEGNFGHVSMRLRNLFSISSLFKIFRYNAALVTFQIIYHYSGEVNSPYFLENQSFLNLNIKSLYENWIYYSLLFLFAGTIIFFVRRKFISKNMLLSSQTKLKSVFPSFLFFYFFKILLFIVSYIFIHYLFSVFDQTLFSQNIFASVYLEKEHLSELNLDASYKRGIYYSALVSLLVFIFLLNVLIKRNSARIKKRTFINIVALIVTSSGIYAGLYSILNTYYNLRFDTVESWSDKDKLLGNFSVKITAIIVLSSLLVFIFNHVYGGSFKLLLKYGILPSKPSEFEAYKLQRNDYDITNHYSQYFFAQVGFYVLNIFYAELLIISVNELSGLFILFSLFPIIVDDYLVLHYYYEKGAEMYWWHRVKKEGFNVLIFVLCIFFLISNGWWILLTIYLIMSMTLYILYPDNFIKQ